MRADDVYYANKGGIGFQSRMARMQIFKNLLSKVERPVRILDVGGTEQFWSKLEFSEQDVHISCVNLFPFEPTRPDITSIQGDATNMPQFDDNSFDIVFSNSVIEHVSTFENQMKMANEIRRIGKRYFVQTPNRYFPMEPHFMRIYWQFIPVPIRVKLLMKGDVGFIKKCDTREQALREIQEIRLMTRSEFQKCFPEGTLIDEKFKFLIKSFMVHHGF